LDPELSKRGCAQDNALWRKTETNGFTHTHISKAVWRCNRDIKFVHGKYSVHWSSLLPLADKTSTVVTRGHTFKLKKRDCKTSVRLNFFSYRIVNFLNSLPESVVSAPSVNCFKHRFHKHCIDLKFATTLLIWSFKISQQACGLNDWRRWWWWWCLIIFPVYMAALRSRCGHYILAL